MTDQPKTILTKKGFVRLSPFAKMGLWVGGMALIMGIIAAATRLLGIDEARWNPRSGGLFALFGLGLILVMMAFEQKPLFSYGFIQSKR